MSKNENILCSVIVPTYNDPDGIVITLKSLLNQKTKIKYEIIAVDNNSQIKLDEILDKHKIKKNKLLRIFFEKKSQSSYAARNLGIKNAKGDIICFIDSDMWVDSKYIEDVLSIYKIFNINKNSPFYLACNVEIVVNKNNIFEKYDKFTGFNIKEYVKKGNFAPTNCLIINKETIRNVGVFDGRLESSGDWEFGQRVFSSGIEQHFSENITLYHPARNSLKSLLNKKTRIGRGFKKLKLLSKKNTNIFRLIIPSNPFIFFKKNNKINWKEKCIFYMLNYIFDHLAVIYGYLSYKKNE